MHLNHCSIVSYLLKLGHPPGDWAGGRRSHVARLCLTWSLIASSPIRDTNGDIRTAHRPSSYWHLHMDNIPSAPAHEYHMKVNIPAYPLMSHIQNWPLVPHRSQVNSLCPKLIAILRNSILMMAVRNYPTAPLPHGPVPGHCDSYTDEWSPDAPESPDLVSSCKCPASPPGHLITSTHWQPICLWPGSCHHIQHSSNIQESQNCQKLTQIKDCLVFHNHNLWLWSKL